jgi:hypothetical protein
LTLDDFEKLAKAATPGPWRECGHKRGGCQCCQVWSLSADAPIAEATRGKWGDDYPSLRFVEGSGGVGSISPQVEAYMEQMTYGEIPDGVGEANAAFIAAANPAVVLALLRIASGLYVEGHDDPADKVCWKCQSVAALIDVLKGEESSR